MIPEKEFNKTRVPPPSDRDHYRETEAKPQLSLPAPKSPIVNLQTALQELNASPQLTDDARWKEYERIFNSFFAFGKKTPTVQVPGGDQGIPEKIVNSVYDSLPKSIRNKGLQLMRFIAQTPDIRVNQMGRLIISGSEVEGSNLLDLIHYAVRQKRDIHEPQGWPTFYEQLLRNNVPRELLAKHIHSLIFEVKEQPVKEIQQQQKIAEPKSEIILKPMGLFGELPSSSALRAPLTRSKTATTRDLRAYNPYFIPSRDKTKDKSKVKSKVKTQSGTGYKKQLWWTADH